MGGLAASIILYGRPVHAEGVDRFYAGKTVRAVIGTPPGGIAKVVVLSPNSVAQARKFYDALLAEVR